MNKILKILLDEGKIRKEEPAFNSSNKGIVKYIIPGVWNFYFYEDSGKIGYIRLWGLEEIKTQTEWDRVKDIVDYADEIMRKQGVRK